MMPLMARRLASMSAFSYCRRFRFFISLYTESAPKRPRSISNRRLSGGRPTSGAADGDPCLASRLPAVTFG